MHYEVDLLDRVALDGTFSYYPIDAVMRRAALVSVGVAPALLLRDHRHAQPVAIIDLGFDGLSAAQAAGELQNVVYTWDYIGGDSNVEGTGEVHGTDVAEIVEDMAPQANLYLLLIGDSVEL